MTDLPVAGRLSFRTKVAFGTGTMAENITLAAVGGYAMFYYNQVLGLPATLAGLALTASIIVDGVVDPFIGSLSDRTRSRWGRRHPFMFFAPIPVATCLFAVFHPPAELAGGWLFAWFTAFVASLKFFSSVFHIPHMALGGELTSDFTERSRVMSYSILAATTGGTVASFVALTYFFRATPEYPRGLMNPEAYGPFAIAAAASVLLIQFTSAWFTRDRIPFMTVPPAGAPRFTAREFLRDIGRALGNRNYLFLLLAVFFYSLMSSVRGGFGLYLSTFFWALRSEDIRWFTVTGFLGGVLAFIITARLHQAFGKPAVMGTAALLSALIPAAPVILHLLGLPPGPASPILLPILMFTSAVSACAGTVVGITAMSAIGDIADENELRHGVRQEGVLFSTRSVFAKLDSALGLFLVGVILDVMEFPRGAAPEAVDPQLIWTLGLIDGPLVLIPAAIAAYFYGRCNVTKARHAETRRLLDAARAAREAQAEPAATPAPERLGPKPGLAAT